MLTRVANEQQFLEANDSLFGGLTNKHRELRKLSAEYAKIRMKNAVFIDTHAYFIYLNKKLCPSYVDAKKSELGVGI